MTTLTANEILKLRTIRSPWLLLAAAQAVILIGAAGKLANRGGASATETAVGAVAHVGLAALFPLVLGILAVAGEYRHKTITDTYLTTPRRGQVIAAKLAVYALIGAGFGLVGTVTALAAATIGLSVTGDAMSWSDSELWRTVGGAIGWNAIFAALGVGVGALIRNLTAAIAAAVAWIALVEGLIGQLIGADASRWLPFSAGSALGRLPNQMGDGLPQWGAAVVLLGYTAVVAVLALTTTVRRDVA